MLEKYYILLIILLYFFTLIVISYFTGRNSGNDAFFLGERKSPWYVVAYGMIGASLSGVTFISVPGWVGSTNFTYMQMVIGYLFGYYVIANILMPLYYRLNLISIYSYLKDRFGDYTYKTGSSFFLLSRLIGAAFRLYLVAIVFELIFQRMELQVPFIVTVLITVVLIWIYTNKGGIKTIIWTDTLQTTFMLLAVILTLYGLSDVMELSFSQMMTRVSEAGYSEWLVFDDFNRKDHFIKYFIGGAFIAISMTGLDQDMMQKNLSCKNVGEAKKNMYWFSWILIFVNLLFLFLGAMLYVYATSNQIPIPEKTDYLFPQIALSGDLGMLVLICFVLGLIASAYSSADSALTALTTSFSVDILEIEKKYDRSGQERTRKTVHIGMSITIILLILLFRVINDKSVIENLFVAATYTYGPLLGLFIFGLYSKNQVRDKYVPVVAVLAPVFTYLLKMSLESILPDFKIGFELILLNALITYIGLSILRKSAPSFQS